jgi:hypothetical protein
MQTSQMVQGFITWSPPIPSWNPIASLTLKIILERPKSFLKIQPSFAHLCVRQQLIALGVECRLTFKAHNSCQHGGHPMVVLAWALN